MGGLHAKRKSSLRPILCSTSINIQRCFPLTILEALRHHVSAARTRGKSTGVATLHNLHNLRLSWPKWDTPPIDMGAMGR